ncbi:MAG TPA: sensor histidine kinase [Acidimicrobiales bacterium]|nr:sensor histidine kinase [Acidimicrobiales bacterium]
MAAVAVLVGQLEMWAPGFMRASGNLHVVGPKWVNVPAFLLSGLAVLWRRRAPAVVLGVVLATGTLQVLAVGATQGLGWYLPMLIALYSVARRCDTRTAVVGLALAVASTGIHDLRDPRITGWADVSLFYDIIVLDWVAGRGFRVRQDRYDELAQRADDVERRRDDHARLVVAKERERIARELHDLVAHSMSLVVVQCLVAVELLDAGQPTAARERVANIERAARQTLGEMRRLLGMLSPDDDTTSLTPQPGVRDVPTLIRQVVDAGLPVELRIEGHECTLPPGLHLSAYRIIQEALTNTLKHADAGHATVELKYCPEALEIGVIDDGASKQETAPVANGDGGRGLIGMRERAALFGGSLHYGPVQGGGWEVRARLPIAVGDQ